MSFKCNYNRPKGNESGNQSTNKDDKEASVGMSMTTQELKKNNETVKNPNANNNNNTNTVNTNEPEVISEDVIDLDDND